MRKDDRGFTLLEVILAIAILSFVFFPLLRYFVDTARINLKITDRQNASFLAESLLENVRSVAVAEDLRTVLAKRGLTEVTEANRKQTDYKAVYKGRLAFDEHWYFAELTVDFAAEKENYNSGTEAEIFFLSSFADIRAAEGSQLEAAAEEFMRRNDHACSSWEAANSPQTMARMSREEIIAHLHRKIKIKIEKNEEEEVTYRVRIYYIYDCDAYGCEGYSYDTSDQADYLCDISKSAEDWENLYLFYKPLEEGDDLEIDTGGVELPLKRLYLVCQEEAAGSRHQIKLQGGQYLKGCVIHTNALVLQQTSALEIKELVSTQEARRVAKVTVAIYKTRPSEQEKKKPLIIMETMKGE